MSYNQSILSREEQLRLWKEKKSEEKKKARIQAPRRASPCLSQSSAKSLVSRTPATRSRSAQTGPLTTRNSNTSRAFDRRGSRPHHSAHTPTVTVEEIEAPININADSPFHNDMVSPLAPICQSTPDGEGSAPRSTHSRDIRDGTETKDISRYNRRRRTDFSTLLLPIPSLREHMTQSTTSPATEPELGKISPALSLSSQISTGCKRNNHLTSSDDERNTLMTPESVTNDSKHSSGSGDNKSERLMDIDEENCITEWVEQDISPPVRSRRRNDSMGLLLPIPSLRNTLTPTDNDAFSEQENTSPTGDSESFDESGLETTAVPSLSPSVDNIRRRRGDRSRRSKGDMRHSRRYDSPTLILPIPSLREEWTPTDDLTTTHSEVVPVREDLSPQKSEQAAPVESSDFAARETASLPSCDASNSAACSDSFISGKSEHAEDNELSATKCCEADVKEFSVDDIEPSKVSYLSGNDEGTNQDSAIRSLYEEYRQPAKLNGRTVLLSVSEEPLQHSMDQIKYLNDQVDQLSVENKLLTGRMYKLRHDYEERITPFRDLFEQNTKLKEENKKLLLLKSENNILKSQNKEIMEGVAMLEGQTMLAIQKALERQKTLEEERDQAKSRVEELERQLRDLLDR